MSTEHIVGELIEAARANRRTPWLYKKIYSLDVDAQRDIATRLRDASIKVPTKLATLIEDVEEPQPTCPQCAKTEPLIKHLQYKIGELEKGQDPLHIIHSLSDEDFFVNCYERTIALMGIDDRLEGIPHEQLLDYIPEHIIIGRAYSLIKELQSFHAQQPIKESSPSPPVIPAQSHKPRVVIVGGTIARSRDEQPIRNALGNKTILHFYSSANRSVPVGDYYVLVKRFVSHSIGDKAKMVAGKLNKPYVEYGGAMGGLPEFIERTILANPP